MAISFSRFCFTDSTRFRHHVVGGILLAIDDLLGVVELTVGSMVNFVADGGLEIHVDSTGDVFAVSSLAEEGVKGIIAKSIL